jgi:hypothetical protein
MPPNWFQACRRALTLGDHAVGITHQLGARFESQSHLSLWFCARTYVLLAGNLILLLGGNFAGL